MTPPVFCSVPTRLVVAPVPELCRQKLTVTVSPGSITPLEGEQLSAVIVAPEGMITGVGVPVHVSELEVPDARVPVEAARNGVVLLRVPERAVVNRVDGHGAVSPQRFHGVRLAARAVEQMSLTLSPAY